MSDLSTYQIVHAEFITLSMVIGFAVSVALSAISMGVQMLLKPQVKRPSQSPLEQRGQTSSVRQPIGYWRFIYGETKVGLHPIYLGATEGNDKLHICGAIACHEIDYFGTVYINDRPVYQDELDADGVPTKGAYVNSAHNNFYLRVKTKFGTDDQTAFSDLVAETSGEWSVDHRCRGHALLYTRHRFSSLYPSGVPNVSVVVKGKKVYDPRDGITRWTPNAALNIRDYLLTLGADGGFGALADEITDAEWSASANICDEFVNSPSSGPALVTHTILSADAAGDHIDLDGDRLKLQTGDRVELTGGGLPAGLSAATAYYVIVEHEQYDDGNESLDIRTPRIKLASTYAGALARSPVNITATGTGTLTKTGEPRYTMNGTFATDQAPRKVLEEMLSCCGGRLVYSGGKFRLMGLAWEAPTLTLDEDDLRGPLKVQTKRARRDRFNAIKGTYLSPVNDWQPSDYPPITNTTYEAQDLGIRIFNELDQPYTSRSGQAQRIAKLMLVRNRFERVAQLEAKLTAYDCKAGEIIAVTNDRWDWAAKPFEILNRKSKIVETEKGPYLGTDFVLNEADESAFDWASTEEEAPAPIIEPTLPNWSIVPAPTSLVARTTSIETEGGDTVYSALLAWSMPETATIDQHGHFEVQIRRSFGRGLLFDGLDDYVDLADDIDLVGIPEALTLEAQLYWDGATGADMGAFTNGQAWIYRRDSDGKIVGAIELATGPVEAVSDNAIVADTYTHAAITWDGANLKLYIDGVLEDTVAAAGDLDAAFISPTIGRGKAQTSATAYWSGRVDDVRVWKQIAKTQTEIADAMGAVLEGREEFLLHYWPMDESSLGFVFDLTIRGNTGTVNGAVYADGAVAPAWDPSWSVGGSQYQTAVTSLDFATQYDMRVRAVNSLNAHSSWSTLFGFTVGGSSGATELDDWGLIIDAVTESKDWGLITDPVTETEDWGAIV